jgi:sulfite exporter TauE/SafE
MSVPPIGSDPIAPPGLKENRRLPLPGTPESAAFKLTPYAVHHDQLARSDYLNLGGIVSYALTGTVDVYASYQATAWGKNIHAIQPALTFGMSWGFSPRRVIRSFARKSAAADASTE